MKTFLLLFALVGITLAQGDLNSSVTADVQSKSRQQLDITNDAFYLPGETPEQKAKIGEFRTQYNTATQPLTQSMLGLRQAMMEKSKAGDNPGAQQVQEQLNARQAEIFTHRDKLEGNIRSVLTDAQKPYYEEAVKLFNTKYLRR